MRQNPPTERLEKTEYAVQHEPRFGTVDIEENAKMRPPALPAGRTNVLDGDRGGPHHATAKIPENSFLSAEAITKKLLGEQARTLMPQTDSGIYLGEIIGETDMHVLQRLSPRMIIAHMKGLLNPFRKLGRRHPSSTRIARRRCDKFVRANGRKNSAGEKHVIGKPVDVEMGSSGDVCATMPMKNRTENQNVLPAPLTPDVHDATLSAIVEAVGQALSADTDDIPIGAIPDILGKLETLRMKLWMRLNDRSRMSASVPPVSQSIAEQAVSLKAAADMMGMSEKYLYHHWRRFSCAFKEGGRIKFLKNQLQRYMERKAEKKESK
jgi:hypothetical protein